MTNYKYHTGEMGKIMTEFAKTNDRALQRFLLDTSHIFMCKETNMGYLQSFFRYPDLLALILAYHKTKDVVVSPRYAVPFDPDCPESRNFWYFIQTYWPSGELAYDNAKKSLDVM